MTLPPPQLKSAPTQLQAHFPVNKTIHPVISPPSPTNRFPQLQVHLPVKQQQNDTSGRKSSSPDIRPLSPQLQAHLPVNNKRHFALKSRVLAF